MGGGGLLHDMCIQYSLKHYMLQATSTSSYTFHSQLIYTTQKVRKLDMFGAISYVI